MGIGLTNLGMFGTGQHTTSGSDESVFLHYINDISVFGAKSYIFEKANKENFQKMLIESVALYSSDTIKQYLYDRLTDEDIDLIVRNHKKLGEILNTRLDEDVFGSGGIDNIMSTITTEKFNKLEEKFQNGVKRYITHKTTGDQAGLWLGNIFGIEPLKSKTTLDTIMGDVQFWNAYVTSNQPLMWLLSHSMSASVFAGSPLISDEVYTSFIGALVKNEDNMIHFFNKLVVDNRIANFFDSPDRCDAVIQSPAAIRAMIKVTDAIVAFLENTTAFPKIQNNEQLKGVLIDGIQNNIIVEDLSRKNKMYLYAPSEMLKDYEKMANDSGLSDKMIKARQSLHDMAENIKEYNKVLEEASNSSGKILAAVLSNSALFQQFIYRTEFFKAWCENKGAITQVLKHETAMATIMGNEKARDALFASTAGMEAVVENEDILEKFKLDHEKMKYLYSSEVAMDKLTHVDINDHYDPSKPTFIVGTKSNGHTQEECDWWIDDTIDGNLVEKFQEKLNTITEEGVNIKFLPGDYIFRLKKQETTLPENSMFVVDQRMEYLNLFSESEKAVKFYIDNKYQQQDSTWKHINSFFIFKENIDKIIIHNLTLRKTHIPNDKVNTIVFFYPEKKANTLLCINSEFTDELVSNSNDSASFSTLCSSNSTSELIVFKCLFVNVKSNVQPVQKTIRSEFEYSTKTASNLDDLANFASGLEVLYYGNRFTGSSISPGGVGSTSSFDMLRIDYDRTSAIISNNDFYVSTVNQIIKTNGNSYETYATMIRSNMNSPTASVAFFFVNNHVNFAVNYGRSTSTMMINFVTGEIASIDNNVFYLFRNYMRFYQMSGQVSPSGPLINIRLSHIYIEKNVIELGSGNNQVTNTHTILQIARESGVYSLSDIKFNNNTVLYGGYTNGKVIEVSGVSVSDLSVKDNLILNGMSLGV